VASPKYVDSPKIQADRNSENEFSSSFSRKKRVSRGALPVVEVTLDPGYQTHQSRKAAELEALRKNWLASKPARSGSSAAVRRGRYASNDRSFRA
jgi:hypothetical protein